ncbi:MAG: TonB-dependent receptor [Carboxylicivirga sp.]|jgi:TonB-linked SusC/RagA family outer membrane protein|nr:TonB-dependent receptor [Carboxylicivirga sp.]
MRLTLFLKLILILLAFIGVSNSTTAQDKAIVRGKIIDAGNDEPLIGVNVVAVNGNDRSLNGTITDINGNFTLELPDEALFLRISYIGYKTVEEMIIDAGATLNISLHEDIAELDVVSVSAKRIEKANTGMEMISKRDMTGSSSKITLGEMTQTPVSSVGQVLQGRASGVQVTAFSGDPGAGLQIRVRGETSLSGNNEPLYVIDGMPLISSGGGSGLSNMEYNPISDIPPEEIESIEVLKDASAVALWGTRAANGVVIITTKRGESNKTSVGITSRLTLKIPKAHLPMLNGDDYKTLMNEADQNRGGDKYHEEVITNLRDNLDNPLYEMHNNNTDWLGEIEKNGMLQNYSFNITGGGNSARYRFSTTFEDNRGPVITTTYKRFNTSFNLDYDVSKKMSISTNISYTNATKGIKDIKDEDKAIPGSVQGAALVRAPTWPIYWQDRYGNTLDGQYAFQELLVANDKTLTNPIAYINNKKSEEKNHRVIGKVQVKLKPLTGLFLSGDIGGDIGAVKGFYFIPPTATGAEPGDPLLRYNKMRLVDRQNIKLYGRATANYNKIIAEKHNFNLTLFSSIDLTKSERIESGGNNIASYKTPTLSTAASYAGNKPLVYGFGESVLTSTGGRLQYKLNDKYIVGGSVSVDGSSKFGPDNRYAVLPTFSGRWRMSGESFMEKVEWLDDLSVRYSWGKTGNGAVDNYTYYSRYTSSLENSYLGIGGVQPSNIRLDNIRWETTIQQNVGFSTELKLWKRFFSMEMYYYQKNTSDLLVKKSALPSSSGFGNLAWYNSGDVLNKGLELEFSYDLIRNKDIHWGVDFNISTLMNRVEKLPEAGQTEGKDNKAGGYWWRLVEGDPLGSFYGYQFKGVYATDADAILRDANGEVIYNLGGHDPNKELDNAKLMKYSGYEFEGGDAIYKDVNGDGVIDELDIVKIGDVNPDVYGGFNTNFTYKNLSFILFFQYSYGNDIINKARMTVEDMATLNNQSSATIRRWRKQGDQTDMPKAAHEYKNKINVLPSDRFVEDGSYLRLKNIQCSYELPKGLKKRFNIKNGRVFMNVTNVYTWTKYIGQDPEVNGRGDQLRGVDNALTAQPIMYTAGVSLSF